MAKGNSIWMAYKRMVGISNKGCFGSRLMGIYL